MTPKFRTNYSEPLIKPYDTGEPGKTQQQFLNQNEPHAVVQRHTLTNKTPSYVDTSDLDPLTHTEKIANLKNSVETKTKELEKKKKEHEEKLENEKFENWKKKENDKRENIQNSDNADKTRNNSKTDKGTPQ